MRRDPHTISVKLFREMNIKPSAAPVKAKVSKSTSTNDLTQAILRYLNLNGFKAWRQNNGAVYSKKREAFLKNPTHKLGISDIIGFKKSTGQFLAIEVKTGRDRLSVEQAYFLDELKQAGGIAFEARSFDEFINNLKSI